VLLEISWTATQRVLNYSFKKSQLLTKISFSNDSIAGFWFFLTKRSVFFLVTNCDFLCGQARRAKRARLWMR